MNFSGLQMDANTSSLKVFKEGDGSMSTPSGLGQSDTEVIPHGYASDELVWQVTVRDTSLNRTYIAPFQSPSGNLKISASLNSTNLTIVVETSGSGTPFPATTWAYNYKLLIP